MATTTKTVDERVLEMRFDNKQFESGVKQSMSTLEKFEDSLNLTGATKGFEEVNKAANRLDFSGIGNAISAAGQKFSMFEMIAQGALLRIGAKVGDIVADLMGHLTTTDLTIRQISEGWTKYADKTSSVQTIMAATAKDFTDTGEQMEYVNEQLDKLNWFTDETSYNFVDMTNNIGKFTSNGIKLDRAVEAMQGIATWAAISGANANQASHAMYNLSQALGTGVVRVTDWASIENANMSTTEFKQMVIETAEALGNLKKTGVDTWTTLDGKQEVSVKNFREGLSKGWFTSEVLTTTLEKYGGFVTVLEEAMDEMGDAFDTTSQMLDAIDEFKEGELDINEIMKETGMTSEEVTTWFEKLSDDTYELGRRSFKAAQEAKTFQEAIDATKDAVSTGWMNTFQLIFGDYEQAKKLWTGLANELWEIFASGGESRNDMLKEWVAAGGRDDLFGGIADAWNSIKEIIETVKDAFNDFFGMEEKVFGVAEAYVGPDGKLTAGMQKTTSILYGITKGIKEFGERAKEWVSVEENLEKIRRIANGVFAVLNFGKRVISVVFSIIKTGLSGLEGNTFLEILASIGDKIVEIEEKIDFTPIIEKVGNALKALVSGVAQFISTVFVSYGEGGGGIGGIFSVIIDSFNVFVRTVGNVIQSLTGLDFSSAIEKYIVSPLQSAREFILGFIDNLKNFGNITIKLPDLSGIKKTAEEFGHALSPIERFGEVIKKIFTGIKNVLGPAAGVIWDITKRIGSAIWGMVDSILSAMEQGDFDKLIGMVNSGIFAVIAGNMASLAGSISTVGKAFAGMSEGVSITGILNNLKDPKKLLGGAADGIKSLVASILPMKQEDEPDVLGSFAKSIALLTASLFVLASIDSKKLGESLTVITTLFADLTGSILLLSSGEAKFNVAKGGLIKMAAAVLIMSLALKSLSKLDAEQIGVGLTALSGTMTILIISLQQLQAIDTKKATAGLLGMSVAMVIMAASMKIFGSMELDEVANGLIAFAGSMLIIVKSFDQMNEKTVIKAAGAMFIMSEAMLRMSIAMKIFGTMGIDDIALAFVAFAGSMIIIVKAFNSISDKALIKTAGAMFIMSEAMLRMSIGLKIMATLGLGGLVVSLAAFAGTMLILFKAFTGMSETKMMATAGAILLVSNAMVVMGAALLIMSALGIKGLIVSLAAFGGAMLIIYKAIESINPGKMVKFAGALSLLAISMTLLGVGLAAMSLTGLKGVLTALIALGGVVAIFAVATKVLGPTTIKTMLAFAGALALVGLAMSLIGVGLTTISVGITALGIALDASIASILTAINLLVIGILTTISNSVTALSMAVIAIIKAICNSIIQTVPLIVETILTLISSTIDSLAKHGGTIINGIFTIIVMLLEGLVQYSPQIIDLFIDFIIGVINGLTNRIGDLLGAVRNFFEAFLNAIVDMLNGLDTSNFANNIQTFKMVAEMMGILALAGKVAGSAMVGVLAVGAVIVELAAVLAILGGLAQIPGLTWIVGEGGKLLVQIGTIIGEFIGSIIGGVVAGFVAQLPQIGQDLSLFMANLQGFIDGAKQIDSSIFDGISTLAGVIIALTAAEIMDGIAAWFTGGSSLVQFGEEINAFAPMLVSFADQVKNVNKEAVKSAAEATLFLCAAANELPNHGGFLQAITGDNSLADFGEELLRYGPKLKAFVTNVQGLDPDSVKGAAEATLTLAKSASELPNSGGLVAAITGDNSLAEFGTELAKYGPKLMKFADAVKGLEADTVTGAAEATLLLAQAAGELPNSGGLVGLITGDNSLAEFSEELVDYAPNLVKFSEKVADLNTTSLEPAMKATADLVKAAGDVPNTGGLASLFAGDNSLADFGEELADYGPYLKIFADKVIGINKESLDGAIEATTALITMTKDVPNTGSIFELFTGESSIADFGEELAGYGPSLKSFSDDVKEVKYEDVKGAISATKRLIEITKDLPNSGGWLQKVTGESSLAKFGEELSAYGEPLKFFAMTVREVTRKDINGAALATERLTQMASSVPKTGGWLQGITGENSLAAFGQELSAYGKPLSDFATKVKDVKVGDVKGAAAATERLTQMTQGVPKTGGWLASITGTNSLAAFGEELAPYGESLAAFVDSISNVNFDFKKVNAAARITEKMVGLSNLIPASGGWVQKLTGDNGLTAFGQEMADFGRPIARYSKLVSTLDDNVDTKTEAIVRAVQVVMVGIPSGYDSSHLTSLGDNLRQFGRGVSRFADTTKDINTAKLGAVVTAIKDISGVSKDISEISGSGLKELAEGLTSIATDTVEDFVQKFVVAITRIKTVAKAMILAVNTGFNEQRGTLLATAQTISTNTYNALTRYLSRSYGISIGSNFVSGIIGGLNSKASALSAAVNALISAIVNPILRGLRIHSPSEVGKDIGMYFDMGIAQGLEKFAGSVAESSEDLTGSIVDPMKEAIQNSSENFLNGVDAPVVRPVMDLSEIQNGYRDIDQLFDRDYAMGVNADLSRIEPKQSVSQQSIDELTEAIKSMNNDDVVEAIDTMRDDISNLQTAMSGMQVVMNTGALVGELVEPMDVAFGAKALVNGRGRY